ncbi:MAG: Ig-like domain-containing protein, partial [Leptospiraceae bacterium]|nr:Ig-like domain-containing protein [Leptospiraceae bacterium]
DSIKNPLKDNIRFSFQVGRDINPPEIILLDGYKKDGQSCKPGKLYSETEALGLSDKIGLCSSLYPNSDNSPIYIHFSENIDSSSLESAFQIQPFINGIKHWKNSHHPSCGKSGDCSEKSLLVFTPSVPWEHGKTYVISLDTSLQDTVGNFLKDSYTTHFTIGTDFKKPRLLRWGMRLNLGSGDCENSDITFFEPDTEGKIIRFIPCKGKSALILEFSEDINPLHFIKNLKISPAFSFQHEWGKASHSDCGSTGHCGNYSRIQITPHENYSNEEIQIQLSNALLDPETNPAETDYSIYFATSPDTESPFLDLDRGAVFADYDTECKGLAFTNISNNEKGICSLAGGIKFKFVFTEAMEESSVLRSFSIQPAVKGIFKKESADTFSFFPTESLVTFQQYKLQFSTEAKDLSGKNLRENFSFSFITGDGTGSMDVTNPSLISVRADAERDPGSCDGKAEMDLLSNDAADDICSFNLNEVLKGPIITFQFSEEMNKDSVLQALHISPSVSGNINWLSSSSLEYRIDKPLQQGIGYEIELTKDAKDIKGNPLNQDFYKLFRVSEYKLSPKVISITGKTASLSDCNKDLYTLKTLNTTTPVSGFCTKENRSFLFDFSEDMDKLSLESYLKLSPFIPLNFTWISAQELEIKPATELQYGQIYSFRLSSEIKDIQGQYMNPAEYSFIAGELDSTKPNLSCSNCGLFLELNEDADGCSNSEADDIQVKDSAIVNKVCRTQTLKLNFSEEIDLNSFTSSFSVSPYFSFSTYQEGTSVYIRALNPLEENTQFEIQLQNSLRDLSGNTLDKAYRFTFQTEQTSPEVIGIGLESQSNCSDINSEGSPIGGDWFMTNCFWKRPSPILSGSSYLFHGGNAVCGTDSKSDNIRIIFSKPMNIHSSISSISLKRISPPQSFIQKASWKWTDSNRVLTLKFSEDLASCSGNQPGSFDLSFNPQDSLTEYPFYLLEIDKSA